MLRLENYIHFFSLIDNRYEGHENLGWRPAKGSQQQKKKVRSSTARVCVGYDRSFHFFFSSPFLISLMIVFPFFKAKEGGVVADSGDVSA